LLNRTTLEKPNRIVRCNDFSHSACRDDPMSEARAAGYQGALGENLYMAEGRLGAPRVALDGWLNSPGTARTSSVPSGAAKGSLS
jgi:uncharacterized protein YkwD